MKVVVIDCGGANLASVTDAFARLGVTVTITRDPLVVASADRVVLPGVGHAGVAMRLLCTHNLHALVPTLTQPVLGICVGLQQLCGWCAEGDVQGLGAITKAPSQRLPTLNALPIPHMGWNQLQLTQPDPLTRHLDDGCYVYFVHSYYVDAAKVEADRVLARTAYGVGHTILANFLDLHDEDL